MFPPLDILFEYWIEHITFRLLCAMFIFSTSIFYTGVPICNWMPLQCLVPWINHLPPVCWSTFWKSSLKWWCVCKFGTMENNFFYCFSFITCCIYLYILLPHNMIILYFCLPYFYVSNSALCLHSTLVLSFYIDVDFILSIDTIPRTHLAQDIRTKH